jgi:acetone carboxylase gamma subunit
MKVRRRMNEYLEIDDTSGQEMIQCNKCKNVFCPVTENFKDFALVSENSLDKAGPGTFFRPSERFTLREFYCPKCAVLLDVEIALKEDPPIWNIQLKPTIRGSET